MAHLSGRSWDKSECFSRHTLNVHVTCGLRAMLSGPFRCCAETRARTCTNTLDRVLVRPRTIILERRGARICERMYAACFFGTTRVQPYPCTYAHKTSSYLHWSRRKWGVRFYRYDAIDTKCSGDLASLADYMKVHIVGNHGACGWYWKRNGIFSISANPRKSAIAPTSSSEGWCRK